MNFIQRIFAAGRLDREATELRYRLSKVLNAVTDDAISNEPEHVLDAPLQGALRRIDSANARRWNSAIDTGRSQIRDEFQLEIDRLNGEIDRLKRITKPGVIMTADDIEVAEILWFTDTAACIDSMNYETFSFVVDPPLPQTISAWMTHCERITETTDNGPATDCDMVELRKSLDKNTKARLKNYRAIKSKNTGPARPTKPVDHTPVG